MVCESGEMCVMCGVSGEMCVICGVCDVWCESGEMCVLVSLLLSLVTRLHTSIQLQGINGVKVNISQVSCDRSASSQAKLNGKNP